MSDLLFYYEKVAPATWVYLSSLLMIGLFFKFNRFWSVRNLDLILLIGLSPGLLFVEKSTHLASFEEKGVPLPQPATPPAEMPDRADTSPTELQSQSLRYWGFVWLFIGSMAIFLRMLSDPNMVRRPLLEPNLSLGGLAFIGCAMFVFLIVNTVAEPGYATLGAASSPADGEESRPSDGPQTTTIKIPGYPPLYVTPVQTRKTLSILSHFFIVLGIVLIGYWHFDNVVNGIGAAAIYLLHPYSSILTNRPEHALPGALLTWSVMFYRRPILAGICVGTAAAVIYYPLFLLPLWLSFYWHRGLLRFIGGLLIALVTMFVIQAIVSPASLLHNLQHMFGLWLPRMANLGGIWSNGWDPAWRLPIMAAFVITGIIFILWPPQKNLGTLMSCSSAIMIGAQFWHAHDGGTQIAWYLPLVLLTVFRPNLEDRVALTVLRPGWIPRRRSGPSLVEKAA